MSIYLRSLLRQSYPPWKKIIGKVTTTHGQTRGLVSVSQFVAKLTDSRDEQASHRDTISKIAAGLAAYYPPFRRILTRELVDNPGILDLPARTRFKKLIHEPWKSLRESHPHYIATPTRSCSRLEF
jgi:hypothetical protein